MLELAEINQEEDYLGNHTSIAVSHPVSLVLSNIVSPVLNISFSVSIISLSLAEVNQEEGYLGNHTSIVVSFVLSHI